MVQKQPVLYTSKCGQNGVKIIVLNGRKPLIFP